MNNQVQTVGSSLAALKDQYVTITNNLANISTTGYKRRRVSFQERLLNALGGGTGGGTSSIAGDVSIDFRQGTMDSTGRPLDLALDGKGFFVLETPAGLRYTRNGAFRANRQGQLVDGVGRIVAGESGPIVVPGTSGTEDVKVATDGAVSVNGQSLGKFKLVVFDKPEKLIPDGESAFSAPSTLEGRAAEDTVVRQGYREMSNVNSMEELVNLISVTRLYEANLKSITTQDEKLKNLLQVAMS